jgi:hypothetical protein
MLLTGSSEHCIYAIKYSVFVLFLSITHSFFFYCLTSISYRLHLFFDILFSNQWMLLPRQLLPRQLLPRQLLLGHLLLSDSCSPDTCSPKTVAPHKHFLPEHLLPMHNCSSDSCSPRTFAPTAVIPTALDQDFEQSNTNHTSIKLR